MGAGVLAAPGTRGVGGQGSRKYSALEGYGDQCWPIRPSILAWRIPLMEKPVRPQSIGRKELHTTKATLRA